MSKDWNAELFVKLYSKMALALGVTPNSGQQKAKLHDTWDEELNEIFEGGTIPRRNQQGLTNQQNNDGQSLLAIYNPGQYIPSTLNPGENIDDLQDLSVLLDTVPLFNWVFKPAGASVANTYESILNYKEYPDEGLTPNEKTKLSEAETTFEDNIDEYEIYMEKYYVQLDAYDSALATEVNGGNPVPRSLKLKLKAALGKWVALGKKTTVERSIAIINQLGPKDPAVFWQRLRDKFENSTLNNSTGGVFQPLGMSPSYADWFKDGGWTEFTFSQTDMDNQRDTEVIGVAGNLDLEFGIVSVSGDGDFNQEKTYVKMDQTTLDFKTELLRVKLDRNWMDPVVLSSTAWRWAKGSPAYGTKLSSGADVTAAQAPEGSMTVLPTSVILSRKLEIKGSFDNTLVQKLNREINANASVGIGPFSISGKFNMENNEGSEKGSVATNKIVADDVQIVAMICEILPESPNPNNNLNWG